MHVDCFNFVSHSTVERVGASSLASRFQVIEEIISLEDEKMLLESVNWTEDTDNQNCK